MQYDGNEPFIFGDKDMEFDGIKCLKTDAPYVADNLQVLKHQIWNEALTFCGIENSNQDKKERLVADEVGKVLNKDYRGRKEGRKKKKKKVSL